MEWILSLICGLSGCAWSEKGDDTRKKTDASFMMLAGVCIQRDRATGSTAQIWMDVVGLEFPLLITLKAIDGNICPIFAFEPPQSLQLLLPWFIG